MRTCALAALAWVACLSGARAAGPGEATAHRGRLVVERTVPGWVEPGEKQVLAAPVLPDLPTWVVTRVADAGDALARGQVVVELDPAEAGWHLRLAQGRLERARARKRVATARLALERLEQQVRVQRASFAIERAGLKAQQGVGLAPRLAVEKAALDRKAAALQLEQARQALAALEARAEAQLAEADLAVARAEAGVEQAQAAMQATRLVARVDGRVRLADGLGPGAVVRAGQALGEVLGMARPQARFLIDVDPSQPFVPAGPVSLQLPAGAGKRIPARIVTARLARPSLGPRPGRLELVVRPDGGGAARGLVPGDPVSLRLQLVVTDEALLVPAQAVVPTPDGPVVWCLEAPAGYRRVELGERTPELVQIRSGLAEGARVSLDPLGSARAAVAPGGEDQAGPKRQEANP